MTYQSGLGRGKHEEERGIYPVEPDRFYSELYNHASVGRNTIKGSVCKEGIELGNGCRESKMRRG